MSDDHAAWGSTVMEHTLDETDWEGLLPRIREGECTPSPGAGANDGILALGSDIARVAQYLAVKHDPMFPKERVLEWLLKQLDRWKKTVVAADFSKNDINISASGSASSKVPHGKGLSIHPHRRRAS